MDDEEQTEIKTNTVVNEDKTETGKLNEYK